MAIKQILLLIPARYDSTRFPGKPLALIKGKPMIQWVYERVNNKYSDHLNVSVFVVTDNAKIEKEVLSFGGKVLMVPEETQSGTERIYLGVQKYFNNKDFDLVVNIQGDEPLIQQNVIEELIEFHLKSEFDIATVVRPENNIGDNPNVVKAVYVPNSGRCLYFSRAAVPFDRGGNRDGFFAHVGIYSFRPKALEKFCGFLPSFYEKIESLEQLRALENGLTIGAIKVNLKLLGVDTPEDISKVEEKLNE